MAYLLYVYRSIVSVLTLISDVLLRSGTGGGLIKPRLYSNGFIRYYSSCRLSDLRYICIYLLRVNCATRMLSSFNDTLRNEMKEIKSPSESRPII